LIGSTLAAVGSSGAATGIGLLEPQPEPTITATSQVAGLLRLRDIARRSRTKPWQIDIQKLRGER
jgi:hypothetical protein